MKHPCGHYDLPPAGLSERGADIYQGEHCSRCCSEALERTRAETKDTNTAKE